MTCSRQYEDELLFSSQFWSAPEIAIQKYHDSRVQNSETCAAEVGWLHEVNILVVVVVVVIIVVVVVVVVILY